jgi:pyruvate kinase
MIKDNSPTRAEVNDVASTLLMGADGLVLAAETAIGNYPIDSVKMINSIIRQYNRWTPESSCKDIIG